MMNSEIRTYNSTDKVGCRLVSKALEAYGIRHIILSPGSRNAPLIMEFARNEFFRTYSVIDERSAGFIALGIAEISCEPVAIVCTSGSALLNYSPALAEAYYKHIPLIAISADRPEEWIDQNDSQTMRQQNALTYVVRGSICVKGELYTDEDIDYASRKLNDILQLCLGGLKGPVHINVPICMPLNGEIKDRISTPFHKIERYDFADKIPVDAARTLASRIHGKKILVVGFIYTPHDRLSKAIATLATLPNVAVICEDLSNIHAKGVINRCDLLFSVPLDSDQLKALSPDVIISFGGAPVSAKFKIFLRKCKATIHWHIGKSDNAIDCFRKLSARIEYDPEGFFPRFASSLAYLGRMSETKSDYGLRWKCFAQSVVASGDETLNQSEIEFNAVTAVDYLLQSSPHIWNVQLGNGMAVRYALASESLNKFHRVDSNRGISGIEGCLSTAIGASYVYKDATLLIIGDMSTAYDLNVLSSGLITPKLKLVVLNNGGGGIFHYVNTTRKLPELDHYFVCEQVLPLREIADACGFRYLKVSSMQELQSGINIMRNENTKPVCLEITTDSIIDAKVFRELTGE